MFQTAYFRQKSLRLLQKKYLSAGRSFQQKGRIDGGAFQQTGQIVGRFIAGAVVISLVTGIYYRPLPDDSPVVSTDTGGSSDRGSNSDNESQAVATPNRLEAFFCSNESPYFPRSETPTLLSLARGLAIGATTVSIRLFMNTFGKYHIVDDEHYAHFLTLVMGGDGRSEHKQGLLTVTNHRSLLDDPGVLSCLLPLWLGIQPKYNRWGICSQEYCFADVVPAFAKGYIGAGQVLPIRRGAGIDQGLLKDFSSILARGEWCHIFPEGGVWQLNGLGGRGAPSCGDLPQESSLPSSIEAVRTRGKLKWGVGKLIAHAPIPVRVLPFAHVGMENLLPQYEWTGKSVMMKILTGEPLKVLIQFGGEITFDDLIQEHEAKYGKMWVYDGENDINGRWKSSDEEKELYRKITLRIERKLEVLTKKVVHSL